MKRDPVSSRRARLLQLERIYAALQLEWYKQASSDDPDWCMMFQLHARLTKLERQVRALRRAA